VTNAYEDAVSVMVNVEHNSTWDIYTDTGFESAISAALGFAVTFTEQGMQEDELASMEA
jgi:beta-lactamase class D